MLYYPDEANSFRNLLQVPNQKVGFHPPNNEARKRTPRFMFILFFLRVFTLLIFLKE